MDEHVPGSIAAGLRRRHIDVTTSDDAGLRRATDRKQLAFATASGRVMVTQDADFLGIHSQGVLHSGIAFCAQGSLSVSQILQKLILIHDLVQPAEMANHVEFP